MITLHSPAKLPDIASQIAHIEGLELQGVDVPVLSELVKKLMRGYITTTTKLSATRIYRAQPVPPPDNIKRLWYPPATLVTRTGRLNLPGESIFYCAEAEGTALVEMRADVGDLVTIMQCKLREPGAIPHVFNIGASLPSAQSKGKRSNIGYESLLDVTKFRDRIETIRSFLVRQFTRIVDVGYEHDYRITVAIGKLHLDSEIDGILYPSISSGLKGLNLALKPDAADRLLRPVACWTVKVERQVSPDALLVRRVATSEQILPDGQIVWKA